MFQSLNVTREKKGSYVVSLYHPLRSSGRTQAHNQLCSDRQNAGTKGLHVLECSACGVVGQVCGLGLSLIPSSPCFCFALNFSCCFKCLLPAGSPRLCRFPSPPELCLLGYSWGGEAHALKLLFLTPACFHSIGTCFEPSWQKLCQS